MVPQPFFIKSSHDCAFKEPLILKIESGIYLKVTVNCPFLAQMLQIRQEIECHTHFLWICFVLKFLRSSHDSASNEPLVLKIESGILESFCQFSIFGPNAPNKEIGSHPIFLKLLLYVKSSTILSWFSNKPLILKIGSVFTILSWFCIHEPLVVIIELGLHKLQNFNLDFSQFALPEW